MAEFWFPTSPLAQEAERERADYAQWLEDVRARLAAGLEAAAEGYAFDWASGRKLVQWLTPTELWRADEIEFVRQREKKRAAPMAEPPGPFSRSSEAFIQWKNTDACLDFYCACGIQSHFDGFFAYGLRCWKCGTAWTMPTTLHAVEGEPANDVIQKLEPNPDESEEYARWKADDA
jgi:hypothetical protein